MDHSRGKKKPGVESLRAFVAIELPEGLKDKLKTLQARLKKGAGRGISRAAPERIHLTLKFLGDIGAESVDKIEAALRSAAEGSPPFGLKAAEVGTFPSLKTPLRLPMPRVVWVGIEECEALSRLQKRVEEELSALGFERDDRPFSPHLTLCRVKTKESQRLMAKYLKGPGLEMKIDESFEVDEIILFKSELSSGGAIHTPLKRISLVAA